MPWFWHRVTFSEDCWEWQGERNHEGYGRLIVKGRKVSAHRVAWEIMHGPIADGLLVLHNCPHGDNPACVNPGHLWLGTQAENMRDKVAKGRLRGTFAGGERHPNAKLTAELVGSMRARHEQGESQAAIARDLGLRQGHISRICSGARWSTLPTKGG